MISWIYHVVKLRIKLASKTVQAKTGTCLYLFEKLFYLREKLCNTKNIFLGTTNNFGKNVSFFAKQACYSAHLRDFSLKFELFTKIKSLASPVQKHDLSDIFGIVSFSVCLCLKPGCHLLNLPYVLLHKYALTWAFIDETLGFYACNGQTNAYFCGKLCSICCKWQLGSMYPSLS